MTAAPRLVVLGRPSGSGFAGTADESRKARLLELLAYLVLADEQVTWETVDAAVWPENAGRDNTQTRNSAVSRLRHWLGSDRNGRPWLPLYSYSPRVTSDLQEWSALLAHGPGRATDAELVQALDLVKGPPFAGTRLRRYQWARPLRDRVTRQITHAAVELAQRQLAHRDYAGAVRSTSRGLLVDPVDQHLWRTLITAAHASGRPSDLREASRRFRALVEEGLLTLEPETTALLTNLAARSRRPS